MEESGQSGLRRFQVNTRMIAATARRRPQLHKTQTGAIGRSDFQKRARIAPLPPLIAERLALIHKHLAVARQAYSDALKRTGRRAFKVDARFVIAAAVTGRSE